MKHEALTNKAHVAAAVVDLYQSAELPRRLSCSVGTVRQNRMSSDNVICIDLRRPYAIRKILLVVCFCFGSSLATVFFLLPHLI